MNNLFVRRVFLRITHSLTSVYYTVPYNTAFYTSRSFYILILLSALEKLKIVYQCFLLGVACF